MYHFFANGGQQAYVIRLVEYGVAKEASVTIDAKLRCMHHN